MSHSHSSQAPASQRRSSISFRLRLVCFKAISAQPSVLINRQAPMLDFGTGKLHDFRAISILDECCRGCRNITIKLSHADSLDRSTSSDQNYPSKNAAPPSTVAMVACSSSWLCSATTKFYIVRYQVVMSIFRSGGGAVSGKPYAISGAHLSLGGDRVIG